jgi:hypothetical protein
VCVVLIWALVVALAFATVSIAQQGRTVVAKPDPIYPAIARQMHLNGKVKVKAVIAADRQFKGCRCVIGFVGRLHIREVSQRDSLGRIVRVRALLCLPINKSQPDGADDQVQQRNASTEC